MDSNNEEKNSSGEQPRSPRPAQARLFFNPFDLVIAAYNALYSNPCSVQFVEGLREKEEGAWGCTQFLDDGSTPEIAVDVECPIRGAIEIMAHELAHVAVGAECNDEHGADWEHAFSAIHERYIRMISEQDEQ